MTDKTVNINTGVSRARVLSKLRAAPVGHVTQAPAHVPDPPGTDQGWGRFRELMTTNRAEVLDATSADWPEVVMGWLAAKGCQRVLFAPETEAGRRLSNSGVTSQPLGAGGPTLVPYDEDVEVMKPALVGEVDAAITGARAAIAATGSVVLWPTRDEPRLMSLLPPIHVALVKASTLAATLGQLIKDQGWAGDMPTNVVLVSGPSKTADIAQVLAFGVHGPKELAVVIIADE